MNLRLGLSPEARAQVARRPVARTLPERKKRRVMNGMPAQRHPSILRRRCRKSASFKRHARPIAIDRLCGSRPALTSLSDQTLRKKVRAAQNLLKAIVCAGCAYCMRSFAHSPPVRLAPPDGEAVHIAGDVARVESPPVDERVRVEDEVSACGGNDGRAWSHALDLAVDGRNGRP